MRPRTKLQLKVANLSSQLPNIEGLMIDWAKVECLEHRGYATKSRVICMECGQRFSPEIVKRKRAICPHCGTSLKIEQSRKRINKQTMFIAKQKFVKSSKSSVVLNWLLITGKKQSLFIIFGRYCNIG